jgi:hypothetical protein
MTEPEPHVLAETEADLAALLERQRRTAPWLAVAESVTAPSRCRALLARIAEPSGRRLATPPS